MSVKVRCNRIQRQKKQDAKNAFHPNTQVASRDKRKQGKSPGKHEEGYKHIHYATSPAFDVT
jgi:hypothetical protein